MRNQLVVTVHYWTNLKIKVWHWIKCMCLIAQIAKKEEKNTKEGKRNKFWNIFYLYVSLSLYSLNTKPVSSVYSAVMVCHQVKFLRGEGRGKENTFFAFPFPIISFVWQKQHGSETTIGCRTTACTATNQLYAKDKWNYIYMTYC